VDLIKWNQTTIEACEVFLYLHRGFMSVINSCINFCKGIFIWSNNGLGVFRLRKKQTIYHMDLRIFVWKVTAWNFSYLCIIQSVWRERDISAACALPKVFEEWLSSCWNSIRVVLLLKNVFVNQILAKNKPLWIQNGGSRDNLVEGSEFSLKNIYWISCVLKMKACHCWKHKSFSRQSFFIMGHWWWCFPLIVLKNILVVWCEKCENFEQFVMFVKLYYEEPINEQSSVSQIGGSQRSLVPRKHSVDLMVCYMLVDLVVLGASISTTIGYPCVI